MDQEKCALPHYPRPPKCLDDSATCKMHLTAAHVVGVGWQHYLYSNNFAHDANTTVTILHKYVCKVSRTCSFNDARVLVDKSTFFWLEFHCRTLTPLTADVQGPDGGFSQTWPAAARAVPSDGQLLAREQELDHVQLLVLAGGDGRVPEGPSWLHDCRVRA